MVKTSEIEFIAVEVIDFLYLFDLVEVNMLTDENKKIYTILLDLINNLIKNRGLFGKEAEVYKHYLICGIEIFINYEEIHDIFLYKNEKHNKYFNKVQKRRYISAYSELLKEINLSLKMNCTNYQQDVRFLANASGIRTANYGTTFRLVGQILFFETNGYGISGNIYDEFINYKIIKKSRAQSYQCKEDRSKLNMFFMRTMLFLEFEEMRRKLYYRYIVGEVIQKITINDLHKKFNKKRKAFFLKRNIFLSSIINDNSVKIYNIDLNKKNDVEKYLEKLSEKLCHNCIFLGKPGGWVSYIGVWYAISNQELNLRSLGRDRRLQETRNCEEAVKIMFENYGLVISSESLNDHYKKIQKFKNLTELVMAEMFNKSDEKFMIPDLTDFFYYHPNMNKNLLNALYELDDS